MEVTVLDKTQEREKVPAIAARGDYMSEWNGEKSFSEIMESVDYSDEDIEVAKSNNHYPELSDKDEAKLRSFVYKQLSRGHFGPWEQSQITFAVKGVSRVTMAQITRHRHLTFDVQSQRYVDFSDTEAILPRSLEDPEHFSRETGAVDVDQREYHKEMYEGIANSAMEAYKSMVEDGVPKEDARFLLPVGMPVNMTFSGNARSFMHVLNLRQRGDAQWEIRELSEKVAGELEEWMPYTGAWWQENGPLRISP